MTPPLYYSFGSSEATTGGVDNANDIADLPSVEEVGGKGLSLIQCSNSGATVPPGSVLTVAFFQPWLERIQVTPEFQQVFGKNKRTCPTLQDCERVKAQCHDLKLTPQQSDALDNVVAGFVATAMDTSSPRLVAVRSSAPQEDSANASLAGLYHTSLGVPVHNNNTDNHHASLLSALLMAFASVLDHRIVAATFTTKMDCRIAVVIQQQIDSAVSGVAFSLDPYTNCYDHAVLSCNRGLGETVVAGVITPDTYKVDKVQGTILSKQVSSEKTMMHVLKSTGGVEEAVNQDPSQPALSDAEILQVAKLVADVETFFDGVPMDIEWAFDGKKQLYLLQARPITTYLPLFPELITPPGEPKHIYMDVIVNSQGWDSCMSILGMEMWGRMLRAAKPHLKPGPDGTMWELHGRQYINWSHFMASIGGMGLFQKTIKLQGGSVERSFENVDLKEYLPSKSPPKCKYVVFEALGEVVSGIPALIKTWWRGEGPFESYLELWNEIYERYGHGGEAEKEDMTLTEAIDETMQCFRKLVPLAKGLLPAMYSKWRVDKIFANDKEAEDLLVTLMMDLEGNPTSEMGHAMVDLASTAEVQEIRSSKEFVEKLEQKRFSTKLQSKLDDFLSKFGCRGMKEIDIATPRTYEDLDGLFERIKHIDTEHNQIHTVQDRKARAHATLLAKAVELGKKDKYIYHSERMRSLMGYREHPKYVFVYMLAYVRRCALKIGEKFVVQGRLEISTEIFKLTTEDIAQGEADPGFDLAGCVRRNMAPIERVAHVKDWPQIFDSRGKIFRGPRKDVEDGIGGDPISAGVVTGRARVLLSPYEKPLVHGEILVTKATEPSWTPIFLNASGVVLEVGGPLQHGAIIAREYGIPCVSGVDHATTIIRDGQLISVDGTDGIIKILEDTGSEEKGGQRLK